MNRIKELNTDTWGVHATLKVHQLISDRIVTVRKDGSQHRVRDFEVTDESGSIKLTIWDDELEEVQAGDLLKLENGYVRSFRGELYLSVGRYGHIEKVGPGPEEDLPAMESKAENAFLELVSGERLPTDEPQDDGIEGLSESEIAALAHDLLLEGRDLSRQGNRADHARVNPRVGGNRVLVVLDLRTR
jgi:replication factor A1